MPWKTRTPGRRFYVRKSWINGKEVFKYLGSGPQAEEAAAEDAARRDKRLALVKERKCDDYDWREAQLPLEQLHYAADLLMKAALMSAGYHRHDRGEWRKKRDEQDNRQSESTGTDGSSQPSTESGAG